MLQVVTGKPGKGMTLGPVAAARQRKLPSSSFIPRGQYQGELIIRNAAARGEVGRPSADHLPGSVVAPASIRRHGTG